MDASGHTVREHFEDRVANAGEVANPAPVGEVAARALGAALDDVAGDDAGREAVPVIGRPVEGMDHRRQRDARVGAAARDHDLRAALQRLDDRPGAVVRIRGRDAIADRRELGAVLHVVE